ncbi:MAG: hypothetical protein MJ135_02695 [Oscillospiraceae bacterium]|nr:hypothetical protein [Oscillospiraceae bacterium]
MRRKNKVFAFVIAMAMLITAGCGEQEVPAQEPEETPQVEEESPVETVTPEPAEVTPEPPSPKMIGMVKYEIGALYCVLNRGDTLKITGIDGSWFTAQLEGTEVIVAKDLVRLETEAQPEETTTYTQRPVALRSGPHISDEENISLKGNQKLTLLDSLGKLALVAKDDVQGFASMDDLGSAKVYSGGGGGGSGSSGGGMADGGDISLGTPALHLKLSEQSIPERELKIPGTGTVFADGTEVYLKIFTQGEEAGILSCDDNTCQVLVNGKEGTLPRFAVSLPEEDPYEVWTGYITEKTTAAPEYRSLYLEIPLKRGQEVQVVDQTGDERFVVEADGQSMYLAIEKVSAKKPASNYYGGGSSGGSSGGSDWTPPAL